MSTVQERIQAMDDFIIVRFFDQFGKAVLNNTELSLDEAVESVPDSVRALPGFSQMVKQGLDQEDTYLSAADSAQMARGVLLALSQDAALAPMLESELAKFKDDKLVVDVILSIGFVSMMILISATTEVKFSNGKWTIKKGPATPEMVRGVLTAFTGRFIVSKPQKP